MLNLFAVATGEPPFRKGNKRVTDSGYILPLEPDQSLDIRQRQEDKTIRLILRNRLGLDATGLACRHCAVSPTTNLAFPLLHIPDGDGITTPSVALR